MSPRRSAAARPGARGIAARRTGRAQRTSPSLGRFAPIFAALGDETRLRIVAVLCAGGALSIAQLTSGTDITRQAVTKHLHVLAGAGLVRDLKVGRERRFEFEPAHLDEARRSLEAIARQWDTALGRLKATLER